MKKTAEHITIVLLNGKEQKRTIYVDERGSKYIYNQRGFWKLEDFTKGRKTIQ